MIAFGQSYTVVISPAYVWQKNVYSHCLFLFFQTVMITLVNESKFVITSDLFSHSND